MERQLIVDLNRSTHRVWQCLPTTWTQHLLQPHLTPIISAETYTQPYISN